MAKEVGVPEPCVFVAMRIMRIVQLATSMRTMRSITRT
nr:MAG TPA: hypothetical protein [Caudoviricetes sp.]